MLISILITLFLMPACGGVFAGDMEHSDRQMAPSHEKGMHHGSAHATPDRNAPHITKAPAIDCCYADSANPKIGIWEPGAAEKTCPKNIVGAFPTTTLSLYSVRDPIYTYYSHAPPSRSEYSSLVGIVKRLD